MKNIIVLAICLISLVINGQNIIPAFNNTALMPAKGVKEYYENIRLAENSIVKKDTTQAIRYYVQAFDHKSAFFYDYINAWRLYNKKPIIDSLVLLSLYKQRRLRYGADFNLEESFDRLIKENPQLNTSFLQYWRKNKTIQSFPFNNKLDTILIKQIKAMVKAEQDPRMHRGKFTNIDSANLYQIVELYKKYGDITEQMVGMEGLQNIDIMLLHISRYKLPQWIPIITDQVLKGNYSNKWYAEKIDSYIQNNISYEKESTCFYYNGGFPLLNKYLLLKEANKEFIEKVNERRAKFFLDSYQEQQSKQLWTFRNGPDLFIYQFFSYGGVFPGATQKDIDQAQKEQDKFIVDFGLKHGNDFLIFNKEDDKYEINLWK